MDRDECDRYAPAFRDAELFARETGEGRGSAVEGTRGSVVTEWRPNGRKTRYAVGAYTYDRNPVQCPSALGPHRTRGVSPDPISRAHDFGHGEWPDPSLAQVYQGHMEVA